jgi:chemotaxis protein methyltransferase CheR
MALGPADLDYLRRLVRTLSAIALDARADEVIATRFALAVRALGVGSAERLLGRLRNEDTGDLHRQVVAALVAPTPGFLIASPSFALFIDRVLPGLVERRAGARRLRFWCPDALGGQEAYSIAIAIRERYADLGDWDISIRATSVVPAYRDQMEAGVFTALEVLGGLPTPVLLRRFARDPADPARWRIHDDLRAMVRVASFDRRGAWPPPWPDECPYDGIFARHLLAYSDRAEAPALLKKLREVLAPDGCLYLGANDAVAGRDALRPLAGSGTGFYEAL